MRADKNVAGHLYSRFRYATQIIRHRVVAYKDSSYVRNKDSWRNSSAITSPKRQHLTPTKLTRKAGKMAIFDRCVVTSWKRYCHRHGHSVTFTTAMLSLGRRGCSKNATTVTVCESVRLRPRKQSTVCTRPMYVLHQRETLNTEEQKEIA